MIQLGAPGVYIVEATSGLRPITGVATSIAAFIDWFPQGPDQEATQIFGLSDFDRIFGGISDQSQASYAINQFFLNGGNSAWVVRAWSSTTPAAAATLTLSPVVVTAANAGAWGNNVRLTVSPNADGSANIGVIRYDGSGKPLVVENFLGVSTNGANYYVDTVNQGSNLISIQATPPPPTALPAFTGTLSAAAPSPLTSTGTAKFTATITSPKGTEARVVTVTLAGDLRSLARNIQRALAAAPGTNPAYDSAFDGVSIDVIGNQLYFKTNRLAPTYDPTELFQTSAADAALGFLVTGAVANQQEYPLKSGADGASPEASDIITAMSQLDKVDLFNLMLIPRMAEIAIEPGTGEAELALLVSNALLYCQQRRAILFIDIPKTVVTPPQMEDWLGNHDTFRNNNSVIYYPRVQVPDPANNFRLRSIPPGGTMAGIYSATDTNRGVWKAPAGIDAVLNNVVQLDYKMTDAENGVLNPLGINCLRVFPVYGEVAWGARTLEGADVIASQWKYVPIRRLALMVEESLFRGTKWVVFEPNDEPLWSKIRVNVDAFMLGLFRQGAFQGGTPAQAYFVKCDAETTTAQDRSLGIVNIKVGFAPLKPAEFVVITIQQIPDLT
jgi:phage tail sheath protein FI